MKAMMMVMMTAINPLACLSPSPPAPGPGLPLRPRSGFGGAAGTQRLPEPGAGTGRDPRRGRAELQLLLPKTPHGHGPVWGAQPGLGS